MIEAQGSFEADGGARRPSPVRHACRYREYRLDVTIPSVLDVSADPTATNRGAAHETTRLRRAASVPSRGTTASRSTSTARLCGEYIGPALEAAGFEVFRADQEQRAGDIRTDMFPGV